MEENKNTSRRSFLENALAGASVIGASTVIRAELNSCIKKQATCTEYFQSYRYFY
jgi:hypothetical protein